MLEPKSDLNQIVIFAKVVETRSFTAAGRMLGLPKSTVSRKVALLEERLGVQLLHRTTRKLALTELGAAFYERCARITSQLEEAERALEHRGQDPHGTLRVAAQHELGPLCAELVSSLLLDHPQLDIELELTGRLPDPLEHGFDVALQLDTPASLRAGVSVSSLGPLRKLLVASPDYLDRHGVPQTLDALASHQLLARPGPRRGVTLVLGGADGGSVELSPRPRLLVNSDAMLHEAALAGVGVALLPEWMCAADLDAGRLRWVLQDWTRDDVHVHAIHPTTLHPSAKLRAFVDGLRERIAPRGRANDRGLRLAPDSSRDHVATG